MRFSHKNVKPKWKKLCFLSLSFSCHEGGPTDWAVEVFCGNKKWKTKLDVSVCLCARVNWIRVEGRPQRINRVTKHIVTQILKRLRTAAAAAEIAEVAWKLAEDVLVAVSRFICFTLFSLLVIYPAKWRDNYFSSFFPLLSFHHPNGLSPGVFPGHFSHSFTLCQRCLSLSHCLLLVNWTTGKFLPSLSACLSLFTPILSFWLLYFTFPFNSGNRKARHCDSRKASEDAAKRKVEVGEEGNA